MKNRSRYWHGILLFGMFIALKGNAQPSFSAGLTIDATCDYFHTDPLGNLYLAEGFSLIKYNNDGKIAARYSNPEFGNIKAVDVMDPFRILLFYGDFNLVVLLDKELNELGSPVLLDDLGFPDVPMVCSSSKGGFWIYDGFENKLFRFNKNLEKEIKGVTLSSLITPGMILTDMKEKNNQVFLHFEGIGILVLDIFGSYKTTLPVQCDRFFQIADNRLFYSRDGAFFLYGLSSYTETQLKIPPVENVLDISIQGSILFIRQKNQILSYKIN